MLEDDEDIKAIVFEGKLETRHQACGFGVVGLFCIVNHPPLGVMAFLVGKPFGCCGEIGKDETGEVGNDIFEEKVTLTLR